MTEEVAAVAETEAPEQTVEQIGEPETPLEDEEEVAKLRRMVLATDGRKVQLEMNELNVIESIKVLEIALAGFGTLSQQQT